MSVRRTYLGLTLSAGVLFGCGPRHAQEANNAHVAVPTASVQALKPNDDESNAIPSHPRRPTCEYPNYGPHGRFSNPEVEAAVRLRLKKPNGYITTAELRGIEAIIILESRDPLDLHFLSCTPKLEVLYLDHSQISDLTPLSGLRGLVNPQLVENQISDLTPLSGLSKGICSRGVAGARAARRN